MPSVVDGIVNYRNIPQGFARSTMLVLALGMWAVPVVQGQVTVGTTVRLQISGVNPGAVFDVYVGTAGLEIGLAGFYEFQSNGSTVTALNGGLDLFCIEMAEDWPTTFKRYEVRPLWEASKNSQGPSSVLIPVTGIGLDRALSLQLLFGEVFSGATYAPETLSAIEVAALQLSIWELSHDTDFDLQPPPNLPPHFWVDGATSGTALATVNQAQSWLNTVHQRVDAQDYSIQMPLWVLHHDDFQDQILPGFGGYLIPEPGTWAAIFGAMALGCVMVVRTRRSRR